MIRNDNGSSLASNRREQVQSRPLAAMKSHVRSESTGGEVRQGSALFGRNTSSPLSGSNHTLTLPVKISVSFRFGCRGAAISLGRTTQNTVCDLLTRYRLCCNSDSEAESSGSLRLCFVRTHNNSFNGFARRSAATGLRKGSSCVLVLISVRRYANCARWKKFYKNVALSA